MNWSAQISPGTSSGKNLALTLEWAPSAPMTCSVVNFPPEARWTSIPGPLPTMRETLSSIISPPISRNLPFIRFNKATLSMMAPLTLTLTTMSPGQCSSTMAMGCSIRPSKGRSIPFKPAWDIPSPHMRW